MIDSPCISTVNKWGIFEIALNGKTEGNPFVDYSIKGTFTGDQEQVTTSGFYDGNGVYKVRFMPSFEGAYHYKIEGNFCDRNFEGNFTAVAPAKGNHGPVRVNGMHFAYEDGTPYFPIGTTCYAWTHQKQELQNKTLESLKCSPFNKIRFCVFPKSYDYNYWDPITFPYEGTPCDCSAMNKLNYDMYTADMAGNKWDFGRFNPTHFQNIEKRIQGLAELGLEADIIVMHPYDRWGFSTMSAACDDLYWNYVVARFSAYHNVWWSLANEYDLMPQKSISDWERYASILVEKDPYHHLRSIHNCTTLYDFNRPWVTHCSIQRQAGNKEIDFIPQWREFYKKPVIIDEMCYEGNINHDWGNITAKEFVRRSWQVLILGGYPGHGETYEHHDNILWWSHGGELHGQSPERLAFILKILNETPNGLGLKPTWELNCAVPDSPCFDMNLYRLYYYNVSSPAFKIFYFDDEHDYSVEIIDTWNMTIENAGTHRGNFRIDLPEREYMAVRVRKQL